MNGKPPGKEEPITAGTEDNTSSETPGSEPVKEDGDAPTDAATEDAPVPEQETGEPLSEQVQDLSINEPAAVQDPSSIIDDEEATTEEEDDGEGEWISSWPESSTSALCIY